MKKLHDVRLLGGLPLIAALLLSGCNTGDAWRTPDEYVNDLFRTAKWRPTDRVPENSVELILVEHIVTFGQGSAQMSDAEKKRLKDFLARARIGPSEQLSLYGPLRDRGQRDPVTTARLQFVRGELLVMGYTAKAPLVARSGQEEKDGISVVVERSVVISPDCEQAIPAPGHRPRFVLGCPNTYNLGQMIVDPLDLERGREAGPADGVFSADSIRAYRKGMSDKATSAVSTK